MAITKEDVERAERAKDAAHTDWQNALVARNNFDRGSSAWLRWDKIVRARKATHDKKHTAVNKLRARYNHQQERKGNT